MTNKETHSLVQSYCLKMRHKTLQHKVAPSRRTAKTAFKGTHLSVQHSVSRKLVSWQTRDTGI